MVNDLNCNGRIDNYVHWFNNIRIHGPLGHVSLIEFKLKFWMSAHSIF
ncbi:IS3 family transposase [Domibacillus aminovorans]